MPPPEERANHRLVNAPFPEEHLEDPVAEEMLQDVEVDFGKRHEPALGCEHPSGHQSMQMGMEVDQIPVRLDGHDDAGGGGGIRARRSEEGLQGIGAALAKLLQEGAVLRKS